MAGTTITSTSRQIGFRSRRCGPRRTRGHAVRDGRPRGERTGYAFRRFDLPLLIHSAVALLDALTLTGRGERMRASGPVERAVMPPDEYRWPRKVSRARYLRHSASRWSSRLQRTDESNADPGAARKWVLQARVESPRSWRSLVEGKMDSGLVPVFGLNDTWENRHLTPRCSAAHSRMRRRAVRKWRFVIVVTICG